MHTTDAPGGGSGAQLYARMVFRLRWAVVLGWLTLVYAAFTLLPIPTSGGAIGNFLPAGSPAMVAQQHSIRAFDVPLTTGTIMVLHKPGGLSAGTLADVALYAASIDQKLPGLHQPYPPDQVLGAIPVINPRDRSTALTYLYFAPSASTGAQQRMSDTYAAHFRIDPGVRAYVTGVVPAQNAQAGYLTSKLALVEYATLALITVVVVVTFRSAVAPLLALISAALAYVTDERLLGWLGREVGMSVPSELSPLIIALLLGVLTDYTVFFMSGFQEQLRAGKNRQDAARAAIALNSPIIAVAGLTVAAGCGALCVAPTTLFSAFGPGLAITVVVGLFTALTLIPAMIAILGSHLFWPSHPQPRDEPDPPTPADQRATFAVRAVDTRRRATVTALVCLIGLVLMALPVSGLRLSLSTTGALPASDPVQQGVAAMTTTFPRGSTSPTEVLIEGKNVNQQRTALAAFQHSVATQPGVSTVFGPADDPFPGSHGVIFAGGADTARLAVIYDSDPLGARATTTLRTLQARDMQLAHAAGLKDVQFAYAGETALASDMARLTFRNLAVILTAAVLVELMLLAIYLRSLIAPLYLLACSVLTVAVALGLTVTIFQHWLGAPGLTFYVPFASAVLLLALGSDYNVFGVGRIWEQAATRSLREAIQVALPGSTKAITAAGVTLAGSFALVALIPLQTFAELAFAMGVGLLIDTFIVRSLLMPALLSLVGPISGWPGHRLSERRTRKVPR